MVVMIFYALSKILNYIYIIHGIKIYCHNLRAWFWPKPDVLDVCFRCQYDNHIIRCYDILIRRWSL